MKKHIIYVLGALTFSLATSSLSFSQTQAQARQPRFSHKGLKAALGLGGGDIPSQSNFNNGQAANLSLGYGFSNRTTLWLTVAGTEFKDVNANNRINNFVGVELSFQYKFMPNSRLQPYGKLGLGAYGLEAKDSATRLEGGGVTLALGADYFISRHLGFGVEVSLKDVEYSKRIEERTGGDRTIDLNPHLNRDARALLFTITLQ